MKKIKKYNCLRDQLNSLIKVLEFNLINKMYSNYLIPIYAFPVINDSLNVWKSKEFCFQVLHNSLYV